jgi:ssRNA-specific RNase YbeY (16S rRNA maturation enzyme)
MIILLMVHGVLHLIGYDHEETKKGAKEMAFKQKEIFQRMMKTVILDDGQPRHPLL